MTVLQDIRYGLRMIVKAPGFTVLAMLALALGICANTTIFSLINGLLLRPLTGVAEPDRLVAVYTSDYSSGLYATSSYPDYIDFRDQSDVFENLAASVQIKLNATGDSETERLRGAIVTGNYFDVIGVRASLGRTLQPADDQPSNALPIVISQALWQRRFNSDPAVVGKTLRLNSTSYTIVGVTAASFRSLRLGLPTEFWLPVTADPDWTTGRRDDRGINVIGRLKRGVTIAQAQTQLSTSMETRGVIVNRQQSQIFYEQAVERTGSLPGVQSATLAAFVPLSAAVTGVMSRLKDTNRSRTKILSSTATSLVQSISTRWAFPSSPDATSMRRTGRAARRS